MISKDLELEHGCTRAVFVLIIATRIKKDEELAQVRNVAPGSKWFRSDGTQALLWAPLSGQHENKS